MPARLNPRHQQIATLKKERAARRAQFERVRQREREMRAVGVDTEFMKKWMKKNRPCCGGK